ncbi:MAG: division/cell wall cluster transcriptional repressor MraZ [Candidatus Yanofskybacteria bacterium CG10_big_fil_rev_8_21_14_0_10_37_15]|uniref:Transcriptional regulator MraZ n=1 Tax=Candidatus Yanofskybacteria bacterium CG10_big_fil_rev_8_21_14_0_10_37_15 TaxID=1975097 RepID=A0A2H0R5H8_9BACT|nr:MAG: division/cell wall cluster transcriptional repressor MraZ [Candidatus Yanofskybacteria bacterium CG10_big_fil_rev_8_21_14_0_10_37_15]
MLIGEYKHNLDSKKRLAIPSRFRKELGESVVLTKGLDGCLFIFPLKNWSPFAEMLGGLSIGKQDTRSFARLFLSGAVEAEFDSLGRILIPDNLKKFSDLNKTVIVAGLFNRLEIWNEKKWNDHKQDLEKNSEKIAEKLGELGLI